jgi:hypothetical protein
MTLSCMCAQRDRDPAGMIPVRDDEGLIQSPGRLAYPAAVDRLDTLSAPLLSIMTPAAKYELKGHTA